MTTAPSIDDYTPFGISPNPNTLHITPGLKAVLAKAKFTINKRQGLCALLGDVGLGKSTLLRYLYGEYAASENALTTLVPTPKFPSPFAFLKYIATDLGVDGKRSFTQQRDEFERWLVDRYEAGKNVVVFVDEAQVLDNAQLELVRGLLNFETHTHKLVQIVLAGQLELRDKLQSEKNRALYSRVSTYSVLDPLTLDETGGMLAHRCDKEGINNPFTPEAIEKLYVVTKGIPRSILKVAALAYEMMLMESIQTIDPQLISDTVPEVAIHE
jgi:general secretion pathway protein A